jgi:ribosomal protein S19
MIEPEMIGLRLGELAPTRKIGVKHAAGGSGEKKPEAKKEDKN